MNTNLKGEVASKDQSSKRPCLELSPRIDELQDQFVQFCKRIELQFSGIKTPHGAILRSIREKMIGSEKLLSNKQLKLAFVSNLVLDLISQGWEIKTQNSKVYVLPTVPDGGAHAEKEIVRNGHLFGRNAQLRDKNVIDFAKSMERRRLHRNGWHSIFSLMRDGGELAEQLRQLNTVADEKEKLSALAQTISPYIQFVEWDAACEHTGLRLGDIWRYFRHTWVNEYKSVPGRSMMMLIRDAAAPNHPIIGIAALGSSVVQHSQRDDWIRWRPQYFVKNLKANPTAKATHWLLDSLDRLIDGLYLDDLFDEGICNNEALAKPTKQVIDNLLTESAVAIKRHRISPQKGEHKGQRTDLQNRKYWQDVARTHLYRSKRCKHLAQLLSIRKIFQANGLVSGSRYNLQDAMQSTAVCSSIAQLVRMIKAEHVGVNMMDIIICGAVPPYNFLLGGKLVCLLLCSPEVTQYYARRYKEQVSIIASAMKGSPVIRKPRLVLLGTTSLYGVGSSQYNRVKIPLEEVGGQPGETISYEKLGHSDGYGTYHFSKETIQIGSTLIARVKDHPIVNSIFGEGVNPLMRKMREALELVGLQSDELLKHGNRRVTYGVRLASNFREVLLGLNKNPCYLIPQANARKQTERIADYWRKRWLSPRITIFRILEEVAQHTLSYPIKHGAMIPLPIDEVESSHSALWDYES